MLWRVDEVALLLIFLLGFLIAIEAGYRLGLRHRERGKESDADHVNSLLAAMLGLLALLLSFTFFMAVDRYDVRKALVLDEANAIGTTFLRSRFLPSERHAEVNELLRDYVASRLAFYSAGIDTAGIEKANLASNRVEGRLWMITVEAANQQPQSLPVRLFVESLNNVIDIREKRQVALDNHVPEAVLYLLLTISVASLGMLGYGCGFARRRRFVSNALFALLIALTLITILDIDRPRRGLITVSQDALVRVQGALERNVQ